MGGAAIEIHAPGAHVSSDLDLVIDAWGLPDVRVRVARVFDQLGFAVDGRHWTLRDLYVEVPGYWTGGDPAVPYRVAPFHFTIIRKEVLLRDRLVGFKHWEQIAYGEQAARMLDRFRPTLDLAWLTPHLRREHVRDAFDALLAIVDAGIPVTEALLERTLDVLHGRPEPEIVADDDD